MQRALESRLASDWMGGRTAGMGAYPPINVFQRGDGFVAVIELPGIDKNDIEIEAKENTIRISGRKSINYDQAASVHRRERLSGVFDRTLSMPIPIDPDAIKAEYAMACSALYLARGERKAADHQDWQLTFESRPMDTQQELQVQQKREVESKQEATIPARVFVPATDIFETDEALTVILEMPGVDKNKVDVKVENDVLKIEGWIDFSRYEGLQPVYTEYNIGNYARSFQLSSKIDQDRISAELRDGVMTLVLPKSEKAKPRKIAVT